MIGSAIKNTLLYNELEKDLQIKFFDRKYKKFLHNIDSLYYTVRVINDWDHDPGCKLFRALLEEYRVKSINSIEPIVLFQNDQYLNGIESEYVMNGIGSSPYLYDIEKMDKYLIFVLHKQLNEKTPALWVQLRSQNLWLNGTHAAVKESLQDIEKIFSVFGIQIAEVVENRIDYAYHTNYIQDPTNFFRIENINRMQKSRFERGSIEFTFRGEFEVETDYVTLGRKKSNNLFFRTYDKTKEVIQQGYKQFFIKLWYLEKLISYFDMYCIEKAFLQPSRHNYKYLDVARLEFYLEHGKDDLKKRAIEILLKEKDLDFDAIGEYADQLVPKVTKILNIEIETKRKFYYSFDESVKTLLRVYSKDAPGYAGKLYRIIDNKQLFHNYITCNNKEQQGVIRFLDYKAVNRFGVPWTRKEKFPTANWWTRLQGVNLNMKHKVDRVDLLREYQKQLSVELLKKRITNSISTYSLYLHGEDVQNEIQNDIVEYLATLNESDIEKAKHYKRKKIVQLADRLDSVSEVYKLDKTLKLYDPETGQTF